MEILCALEAGIVTRAEVMASSGVSRATLTRRLARARWVRGDVGQVDEAPDDGDLIHLEVVAGHEPRGPGGDWYSLADDKHSLEGERVGRVLINDGQGHPRVRKLWAGQLTKDPEAEKKSAEPTHPTAYRPHPKLRGGRG